jgi:hypothetical protein
MEVGDTVVKISDLESPDEKEPAPADAALGGARGALEVGLLIAIGLAALVAEKMADAMMAAIGERSPQPGGANDVEGDEEEAAEPDVSMAVFAGAGLGLVLESGRLLTRMVARFDRALRPLSLVAIIPPVDRAARLLEGKAVRMNAAWLRERRESEQLARAFADALVPHLIDEVIDRIDLTQEVLEHVDLDRVADTIAIDRLIDRVDIDEVVARVDVGPIVDRVDVAGVVERLDLAAIAQGVIEELDLPAIIRGSTETIAAETVDGVREQSMRADQLVARLVDRALLRRNGAAAGALADQGDRVEDES